MDPFNLETNIFHFLQIFLIKGLKVTNNSELNGVGPDIIKITDIKI